MCLKLLKALLFKNLKTDVERQYFELGIQIVSLFLYIGTLGEMAIQSCEYHIVPRPRKKGFLIVHTNCQLVSSLHCKTIINNQLNN